MILSWMSQSELQHESVDRAFPKWWTLCLFRSLNLPTLDACFIPPTASLCEAKSALDDFGRSIDAYQVLVRSDGGREDKSYPRAGLTYSIEIAFEEIKYFLSLKRAVILLEPTNRFSNLFSINVSVDDRLEWVVEALSCGFDTSDLQRGLVTPEWRWSGKLSKNDAFSKIDFRCWEGGAVKTATHSERVFQRLKSIADLCNLGPSNSGAERARSMLIESNNTCLFQEKRAMPDRKQVAHVIEDASILATALGRSSPPFTLAYAQLYNRKRIYWDLSFGKTKWARP